MSANRKSTECKDLIHRRMKNLQEKELADAKAKEALKSETLRNKRKRQRAARAARKLLVTYQQCAKLITPPLQVTSSNKQNLELVKPSSAKNNKASRTPCPVANVAEKKSDVILVNDTFSSTNSNVNIDNKKGSTSPGPKKAQSQFKRRHNLPKTDSTLLQSVASVKKSQTNIISLRMEKIRNSASSNCLPNKVPNQTPLHQSNETIPITNKNVSNCFKDYKIPLITSDKSSKSMKNEHESEDMDWESKETEQIIYEVNKARSCVNEIGKNDNFYRKSKEAVRSPAFLELSDSADVFLVVDTNVFIAALPFIKDIIKVKLPGLGYILVYLPLRVVHELDALKENFELKQEVQFNARAAIRYINDCLRVDHPRIKCQTREQYLQMTTAIENVDTTSDDKILLSCLQLRSEQPKRVILLSNDVNLRNKALIENLDSYSVAEFKDYMCDLKSASRIAGESNDVCDVSYQRLKKEFSASDKMLQTLLDESWNIVANELQSVKTTCEINPKDEALMQQLIGAISALMEFVIALKDYILHSSNQLVVQRLAASFSSITGKSSDQYVPILATITSTSGRDLLTRAEEEFLRLLNEFKEIKNYCAGS